MFAKWSADEGWGTRSSALMRIPTTTSPFGFRVKPQQIGILKKTPKYGTMKMIDLSHVRSIPKERLQSAIFSLVDS